MSFAFQEKKLYNTQVNVSEIIDSTDGIKCFLFYFIVISTRVFSFEELLSSLLSKGIENINSVVHIAYFAISDRERFV